MKIIEWKMNNVKNIEKFRREIVKSLIGIAENRIGLFEEYNQKLGYKRENTEDAAFQTIMLMSDPGTPVFISPYVTLLYALRPPVSDNGIVSFAFLGNTIYNEDGSLAYHSDQLIRDFLEYISVLIQNYQDSFLEELTINDAQDISDEELMYKFFFDSLACLDTIPDQLVFPVNFDFQDEHAQNLYYTLRLIGIDNIRIGLGKRKNADGPSFVCVMPA